MVPQILDGKAQLFWAAPEERNFDNRPTQKRNPIRLNLDQLDQNLVRLQPGLRGSPEVGRIPGFTLVRLGDNQLREGSLALFPFMRRKQSLSQTRGYPERTNRTPKHSTVVSCSMGYRYPKKF